MSKKIYRDYGQLYSESNNYAPAPRIPANESYRQVKNLTYKGEGLSFPFIDKAFISFSYGGRKIEDFNLIAISVNDRYDRLTPPSHENDVTLYKMLDGQHYWGCHYNAREMTLMLATDGMEQENLDDFKNWFSAGNIKLLILSLHPNRGILARISLAPEISLLPFKKNKTVIINLLEIDITVILYKGNIRLDFVMDLPFWYAINNILGEVIEDEYGYRRLANKLIDANGNVLRELDSDGYKIVMEDKIPTSDMITDDINFSDGIRLIPYNKYKYTLTNDIILAKNEEGKLIGGTPVVNESANGESRIGIAEIDNDKVDSRDYESDNYPISGAITGPIYIQTYELDENMTLILNTWVHQNCIILLEDGKVLPINNEYTYTMLRYLPIKKGSTIKYNRKFYNSLVVIVLYDKNTQLLIDSVQLVRKDLAKYLWIADKDYYIRLYAQISDDEMLYYSNDINNIISVNLLTFKEGQEALSINLDYINYVDNDWIADDYLIDINNPKDGCYITGLATYNNYTVQSMVKYLEAGINSTIINKGAKQLVLFLYSKKDKSLIDIEFDVQEYTFTQLYYIRWYILVDGKANLNMNDYIDVKLFSFQIGSTSSYFNYFYSGTAPSYPELNFSIPIHFNEKGYIDTFNNEFILSDDNKPYNTLCLESRLKHELRLTNPSVFSAYNRVIDILRDPETLNSDITSLIQKLKLVVGHILVRNWVISCINIYKNTFDNQLDREESEFLTKFTQEMRNMILLYMPYFFAEADDISLEESENDPEEINVIKTIIADYDYTASNMNESTKLLTLRVGDGFTVSVIATNAKYYQWQYSVDKGISWNLLLLNTKWTGTNSSILQCNKSAGGISLSELNYQLRCLVSNDTNHVYTDNLSLKKSTSSIQFGFVSNVNYNVQYIHSEVAISISAVNFNPDTVRILYRPRQLEGEEENPWQILPFDDPESDWCQWTEGSTLIIDNNDIKFKFIPHDIVVNNYWYTIQIQNLLNSTETAICSAVQISVNEMVALTLKITNSTNNQTLIYNSGRVEVSLLQNISPSFIIKEGDTIKFETFVEKNEVKYGLSSSFGVIYEEFKNGKWQEIRNGQSISSSYGRIYWKTTINDNNRRIRGKVCYSYSSNPKTSIQVLFPSEEGFLINKVISNNSTADYVVDPIYSSESKIVHVGEPLTISINDANDPEYGITYQWYYKNDLNDLNLILLDGQTEATLTIPVTTLTDTGYYRVALKNEQNIFNQGTEYYVNVIVVELVQIINDLEDAINVTCSIANLTENCPITLSITTRNVLYYNWYLQLPNQIAQVLEVTTTDANTEGIFNSINSLTGEIICKINSSNYTYEYFKNNKASIWCLCSNGVLTIRTHIVTVNVNVQQFLYFNFSTINNGSWYWYHPRIGSNNTIYTYSNVNKLTGIVSLTGTPRSIILSGTSSSYSTIGTIVIEPENQNYYWNKILLTLVPNIRNFDGSDGTDNFVVYTRLRYRLKSGGFNDDIIVIYNTNEQVKNLLIYDSSLQKYNDVAEILVQLLPYCKKDYTEVYFLNNSIRYRGYPLTDVYNMAGSEIGFVLQGEKTIRPEVEVTTQQPQVNIPAYTEIQSSNNSTPNNMHGYISLQQPVSTIKYYVPGLTSLESNLITSAEIIDINKFITVMKNNGKDMIYRFIFKKNIIEDQLVYGFEYNKKTFYKLDDIEETLGMHIEYNTTSIEVMTWDLETLQFIGTGIMELLLLIDTGMILEIKITYPLTIDLNLKQSLVVHINCATGENNINYKYNRIKWLNSALNNLTEPKQICYLSSLRYKQSYTAIENAGDMIFYNNFIFTEQNHFDKLTGRIKAWSLLDKALCHKLTYDGKVPILQLKIYYKNYYL